MLLPFVSPLWVEPIITPACSQCTALKLTVLTAFEFKASPHRKESEKRHIYQCMVKNKVAEILKYIEKELGQVPMGTNSQFTKLT